MIALRLVAVFALLFIAACKHATSCTHCLNRDKLIVATIDTGGLSPELKWGEFGYYSKWRRYSYAIQSNEPALGRLADLREFPLLLQAMQSSKLDHYEKAVILSQIQTLSRCDFEIPVYQGDDADAAQRESLAMWTNWWEYYGASLAETLPTQGKRYPSAWKQIAPSPYLACPSYPLSIPKAWSCTLSFRSGDYGGTTEEIIEFVVNDDRCELTRRYRHGWPGKAEWTNEVWEDFSREEAEQFLAMLIYAIDHPWFYANDSLSDTELELEGVRVRGIRGRPDQWSDYYAFSEWSGILDADQRVLINDDPWHWHTIDHKAANQVRLDGGAFGVVFRVIRDAFPDPSFNPAKSRWRKLATKTDNDVRR